MQTWGNILLEWFLIRKYFGLTKLTFPYKEKKNTRK